MRVMVHDLLARCGYRVTVFGFRRERYNRDYAPAWPYVPLGTTADGAVVDRYTLCNSHGMTVRVITYGATVPRALQAAQSRSVVIVGSVLPDGEPANRISAPIIVQGGTAGVFRFTPAKCR